MNTEKQMRKHSNYGYSRIAEILITLVLIVDVLSLKIPRTGGGASKLNAVYILAPFIFVILILFRILSGKFIIDRSLFNIFFLSLSAWAVVNSYLFSIDRSISSSYSILLVFWWVTYLVFTQSRRVVPQRTLKYYADFLFLYILVSILPRWRPVKCGCLVLPRSLVEIRWLCLR